MANFVVSVSAADAAVLKAGQAAAVAGMQALGQTARIAPAAGDERELFGGLEIIQLLVEIAGVISLGVVSNAVYDALKTRLAGATASPRMIGRTRMEIIDERNGLKIVIEQVEEATAADAAAP